MSSLARPRRPSLRSSSRRSVTAFRKSEVVLQAKAEWSGNGAARKARRGKVKAKYRDPKTNETWSGRGRMASWLKSKQDAGEKIEKYLV